MHLRASDFEERAFHELAAAQRALSTQARLRHEQQAHLYALRAHRLEQCSPGQPS